MHPWRFWIEVEFDHASAVVIHGPGRFFTAWEVKEKVRQLRASEEKGISEGVIPPNVEVNYRVHEEGR